MCGEDVNVLDQPKESESINSGEPVSENEPKPKGEESAQMRIDRESTTYIRLLAPRDDIQGALARRIRELKTVLSLFS